MRARALLRFPPFATADRPARRRDRPQPDQARIVGHNAQYFLKNNGGIVISIKASCIDSTVPAEAVFAREVKKMQEMQIKASAAMVPAFQGMHGSSSRSRGSDWSHVGGHTEGFSPQSSSSIYRIISFAFTLRSQPKEQLTLEPYERDHAVVVGIYRSQKKKKDD